MSKNKDIDPSRSTDLNTIIGKGSTIKGDLIVQHSMRVDGSVKGTIEANGFLVVGKGGDVDGEITVANLVIGGKVKGNINASGKVILESSSSFHGDMRTSKLVIEEGAVFEGKCFMGETSKKEEKKESELNWQVESADLNETAETKVI